MCVSKEQGGVGASDHGCMNVDCGNLGFKPRTRGVAMSGAASATHWGPRAPGGPRNIFFIYFSSVSGMQQVTVRGSSNDCVCVLFPLCAALNVLCDVGMLSHCCGSDDCAAVGPRPYGERMHVHRAQGMGGGQMAGGPTQDLHRGPVQLSYATA